jgi:hypothetical protein
VSATAIWTQESASQYTPYFKRVCENGPPNNPSAASLDIDNNALITHIDNKLISVCGSRYGYGACAKSNGSLPQDQVIGGRILYEFNIFPQGISDDPLYSNVIFFDMTRQRHNHLWYLVSGHHTLSDIGENLLFPSDEDPPKDIEYPNDDNSSNDEDNTPENGKIYQWDAPTIPISMNYPTYDGIINGFIIKKATFHEFARFALAPFVPNNQFPIQGSACSPFYNWSLIQYTKNENGKFVEDNDEVSFSTPVFVNTDGYIVSYNSSHNRWTALRSSNNINYYSSGNNPWIIEIPTQLVISITAANPGFQDGSTFSFSTFKSEENVYGKNNYLKLEASEYIDTY